MRALVTLVCLLLAAEAGAQDEIGRFFARWQELEQEQNPAVADFYADNARILVTWSYRNGSTFERVWTGRQYKTLIRKWWPVPDSEAREQSPAMSLYSNVRTKRLPDGYKISGERYFVGDCSNDTSWYILVTEDSEGILTIVEEKATMAVDSFCP
ncbi:MAG: hypothetical protein AAGC71_10900 [Pseudomonadota bacterium]